MANFFNYKSEQEPEKAPNKEKPEMRIPSHMVIIDGANLIKVVDDNSNILEGKVDIGNGTHRIWNPLNYSPETGEILK